MTNYGSIDDVVLEESPQEEETAPLIKEGDNEEKEEAKEEEEKGKEEEETTTNKKKKQLDEHFHSVWSTLVFRWLRPLLILGNEQEKLDPQDLDTLPLPKNCVTDSVVERFFVCWDREMERAEKQKVSNPSRYRPPSLAWAFFYAFGADFVWAGFLKLIHDLALFVGPVVLFELIYFFGDAAAPYQRGLWLTLAVTVAQLVMSFSLRHYFFKCYLTGLRLRTSVVMAVYRKALAMSTAERQARSTGEITNLMSIDALRMQDLTPYLHAIWYSFLQIGIAFYFLWRLLGPSCLGGIAVIVVMIPVAKAVAEWMGSMQKTLMESKDERVDLNTEILKGMRVLKLQAWEESFEKRILGLRATELGRLGKYFVGAGTSTILWNATPAAVAVTTFGVYILMGNQLHVATALTALALFDILRFPLFMLPHVINNIVEAAVSAGRIRSFLLGEEYKGWEKGSLLASGIQIMNGSFAYEGHKPKVKGVETDHLTKVLAEKQWEVALLKSQLEETEKRIKELSSNETSAILEGEDGAPEEKKKNVLCLNRVDFDCGGGELIAVVGSVGSGSSSLINAILGEVRQVNGTTNVFGTTSYFRQVPFILNETLRSNILFGHKKDEEIDEKRYQTAISCCALRHDLDLLPAGDLTEIGERGITLSGGQKARVALARAVYHDADISLLDDPLAAVDAHVGNHLFQKCIIDELLLGKSSNDDTKRRSVILVTNALQYLSHPLVSKIVVLQDGEIAESGTYGELTRSDTLFSKFMSVLSDTGAPKEEESLPDLSVISEDSGSSEMLDKNMPTALGKLKEGSGGLTTDEYMEREKGHVDRTVYYAWVKAAGGWCLPFGFFVIYVFVEVSNVGARWWLTYWSQFAHASTQLKFLGIYLSFNVALVVGVSLRVSLMYVCSLRASRRIFTRLLGVIMQAPMSFFDTTPTGRIINRFSKDMYTVDEQLVVAVRDYFDSLFIILSTLVVISFVTPLFILFLIPIVMFYVAQQQYFVMSYRELKRLDLIGRSPIYALFGETLDGVSTIRAFSAQDAFSTSLEEMLDRQQHAYYLTCAAKCWLAIRLELVGTLIIGVACLCAVLEHRTMGGSAQFAGLAGLSISFALNITQDLNWSVRMASDLETYMVSVERIAQYCEIKSEAPRRKLLDTALPETWPAYGEVRFIGTTLRYRPELPLVLKGLDIVIPAGSKVGVVGRTGAGKSTLVMALLRLVELEDGKIVLDGIDHRLVGLQTLRSHIAVIPQDPVLFSGTVKSNLDPFGEHPEPLLLEALARVGLYMDSNGDGRVRELSDPVLESGSNFSVGQRQLLVIARALLTGATIVVMDEATAAVDVDTDAKIQAVMKNEFAEATCITVAHRINTILDSDYILVMDDGKALEFDKPDQLLQKQSSFRELVEASNVTTAED